MLGIKPGNLCPSNAGTIQLGFDTQTGQECWAYPLICDKVASKRTATSIRGGPFLVHILLLRSICLTYEHYLCVFQTNGMRCTE